MTFGAPKFLYLLFSLPVAALLFWIILHQVERVRRQFQMRQVLRTSNLSTRARYFRLTLLFVLGCASLILALAEPQVEHQKQREIYQKIDVVFLLDNSLSMRARDLAPSRLERAREEIQNFIIHKANANIGRMGLVSFSGSSVILSYLTRDASNILFYLDYLEAERLPTFGTDIAGGIKNGTMLVKKEQVLDQSLKTENIIFVLISDGEDNGKGLQDVVAKAAEEGLRIYSIGLGSQTGGYIPLGEQDGQTIYLVDERGKKILATFDEGTLRWVAEATRGLYYRSFTGNQLYQNLSDILWNAREVVGIETVREKTPLHYWFLMAGFAALALFLIN
ncbi:MAG: VWA domain-containing protein [Acidobacteria bacterium]|nr:VWA domain-containing protein [Acidobacteriota bacterium]